MMAISSPLVVAHWPLTGVSTLSPCHLNLLSSTMETYLEHNVEHRNMVIMDISLDLDKWNMHKCLGFKVSTLDIGT